MTSREEKVRIFVSVGISDEAREQLVDAVERVRRDVPDGIQWARPEGMHLTLKFLGNVASSRLPPLYECLAPVGTEYVPFSLELTGLGMFPNRNKPRVLWAGVGGDLGALSRLQDATEVAITRVGHPAEDRPFRPHITLGRPRRTISDAQKARIGAVVTSLSPPCPVGWDVRSIDVMQSELHPSGARYTVLCSVPLKSPPPSGGG